MIIVTRPNREHTVTIESTGSPAIRESKSTLKIRLKSGYLPPTPHPVPLHILVMPVMLGNNNDSMPLFDEPS